MELWECVQQPCLFPNRVITKSQIHLYH
uniref:Uncharacterized protein n=1 Tax=Anguilla anguilla TaxID=7936 RepID=A0A0E9TT10_ANGAN